MERAGSSSLATAQVALHMAPRHCKRFRVPKQPSRSVAKKEDLDLTPPEEIRARRIRRWVLFGTLAACVIGMAIYFVAPRIAGAIKAWQSRRLAREAFVLIDPKNWTEANAKARESWQELDGQNRLTIDDRREFVGAALMAGEISIAAKQVEALLSQPGGP